MKKYETIVKEFMSELSDESLKYLVSCLTQRLGDDITEAVNVMSQDNELDGLFSAAKTAWEFYDIIDLAQNIAEREAKKRSQESGYDGEESPAKKRNSA